MINCKAKKLLNFCEKNDGKVKNGDTKGDREGRLRFMEGGISVLNLVFEIESKKGSIIEKVKIEPGIESDLRIE